MWNSRLSVSESRESAWVRVVVRIAVVVVFCVGCEHSGVHQIATHPPAISGACNESPLLHLRRVNARETDTYDVSVSCRGEVQAALGVMQRAVRQWMLAPSEMQFLHKMLDDTPGNEGAAHWECSHASSLKIVWIRNGTLVVREDNCDGEFDPDTIPLSNALRKIIRF
jgi:hypothetical protein